MVSFLKKAMAVLGLLIWGYSVVMLLCILVSFLFWALGYINIIWWDFFSYLALSGFSIITGILSYKKINDWLE
jgi:hypothetical protein